MGHKQQSMREPMANAIRVVSELPADEPSFDVSGSDVPALLAAEERHFWHRTRNRIIERRLAAHGVRPGARFLELGCGAGCVAAHLSRAGYDVTGVEGHRRLLEVAATRAPRASFWLHDLRRGVDELPDREFDAAALFDVVEHLDDPLAALSAAARCVRPGGLVVGTVPALMSLWSAIDEHSGHKLRYTRATLRALLDRVPGARVVEIAPFNRVLVPLLWIQRRIVGRRGDDAGATANLSVPPWPVNEALAAAVGVEQRLARWIDRTPIEGSSIWFAVRRTAAEM